MPFGDPFKQVAKDGGAGGHDQGASGAQLLYGNLEGPDTEGIKEAGSHLDFHLGEGGPELVDLGGNEGNEEAAPGDARG